VSFAFATCSAFPEGWDDDQEIASLLGAKFVIWDDEGVDWDAFDRVIVRSTWDFAGRVEQFLSWCATVGDARLRNAPDTIAFNADKRYLRELSVPVTPTAFIAPGEPLPGLEGEVVVKPSVSAGARDTGRFAPELHGSAAELVAQIHAAGKTVMIQPYLASVDRGGEISVVFFDGEPSHAIAKRPILREQGVAPLDPGSLGVAAVMLEDNLISATEAGDAQLALAQRAIDQIAREFGTPLYARVDLVEDDFGAPMVLELELIEPALYFRHAPGASARFARAVRRG
jgi:hypothetical protein